MAAYKLADLLRFFIDMVTIPAGSRSVWYEKEKRLPHMTDNKQDHAKAGWIGRLRQLFGRVPVDRYAEIPLYRHIVAAARQPHFYAEWGVPDTRDGRREMIGLHAILVMRRLRQGGVKGAKLAQKLFDLMFADFDRNFREEGVGDLSVGKHVKRAASTFLARFEAIDQAFEHDDRSALEDALQRNLFTTGDPPTSQNLRNLSEHLSLTDKRLSAVDVTTLLDGSAELAELHLPTTTGAGARQND